MPDVTKPCVICGGEVVRNPKYSRVQWEATQCCSKSCAATRQVLTERTNDLTAHRLHLAVARRQCDLALERMREAEGRVEDLRNQLASVLDVRVYGPGGAPTIEGVET